MKHHSLRSQAIYDSSNLRAEDGWRVQDGRTALYNAILAPVLLFAIIAIILLLFCHPAFGQAAGREIDGTVKNATRAVISHSAVTSDRHAPGRSGPRPALEQSAPWTPR